MAEASSEIHAVLYHADASWQSGYAALFKLSGLHAACAAGMDELQQLADNCRTDVVIMAPQPAAEQLLDTIQSLKSPTSAVADVPLIVIFPASTPPEIAIQSLHCGAHDYLIEPCNEIELLTKVAIIAKLKHATDEFRRLAVRDSLTGLYDRRYLLTRAGEELSRAKRYNLPITFMLLDVDALARVNQNYGSDAGDALLRLVAELLQRAKRESDVLARLAGDQFAFVLYNTDMVSATVLASRIKSRLEKLEFPFDPDYNVTVCIGLAGATASPKLDLTSDALQQEAREALQQAKALGPGSIVLGEKQYIEGLPTTDSI